MATDRKLISVYVPDDVLEALQQYQQDKGIRSGSSAVVDALREFFKLGTAAAFAPIERVEELEQRLNQLSELVEELRRSPVRQQSITQPATLQKPPKQAIGSRNDVPADPDGTAALQNGRGLQLIQLANRLGVTRESVRKNAAKGAEHFALWSQQGNDDPRYRKQADPDGYQWERRENGLFYPLASSTQ